MQSQNLTYEQISHHPNEKNLILWKFVKFFLKNFSRSEKFGGIWWGDLKYYIIWLGKCQDTHSHPKMVKNGHFLGGCPDLPFFSKISNFLQKKNFFFIRFIFSPQLKEEIPYVTDTVSQRRCLVEVSYARSSMPSTSLFTSVSQHTFKHVRSPGFSHLQNHSYSSLFAYWKLRSSSTRLRRLIRSTLDVSLSTRGVPRRSRFTTQFEFNTLLSSNSAQKQRVLCVIHVRTLRLLSHLLCGVSVRLWPTLRISDIAFYQTSLRPQLRCNKLVWFTLSYHLDRPNSFDSLRVRRSSSYCTFVKRESRQMFEWMLTHHQLCWTASSTLLR
jgi:hypothetical protein